MRLTMRQASLLAEKLWSRSYPAPTGTVGIVQRRKSSPRFLVGVAFLDGSKAITLGSSNVDWEAAFANAAASGHCTTDFEIRSDNWPQQVRPGTRDWRYRIR